MRLSILTPLLIFSWVPALVQSVGQNGNGGASFMKNPFDTIPPHQLSSMLDRVSTVVGKRIEEKIRYAEESQKRRHLDDQISDDTYPCGHVYARITKEDLREMADLIINGFYPPTGALAAFNAVANEVFKESVIQDIEARKICTTCKDMAMLYADNEDLDLSGDEPNNFQSYCGEDTDGYDSPISGLMIVPIETGTNDYVIGKHQAHIAGHAFFFTQILEFTPTNLYPDLASVLDEVQARNATELEKATDFFARYYDIIPSMIAASAGVVSVVPDGPGYGESPNSMRSIFVKSEYQAAAIPLYLFAKDWFATKGEGCSIVDNKVSLSGYSEGGYASIAIAGAVDKLGATIVNVNAGAPASKISTAQLLYIVERIEGGTFPLSEWGWSQFLVGNMGYSYSSTNADLANSLVEGQNLLRDDWIANVTLWIENDFSTFEAFAVNPIMDPLTMINPDFLAILLKAIADSEIDPCGTYSQPGVTDKLCESLQSSDLIDILESATYPITLCHSPQDDVITYENLPDNIDDLDNVNEFALLPVSGDHFAASSTCAFISIYPFSSYGGFVSSVMEDLDEPGECARIPTSSPPTTMEPTPGPTDPSTNAMEPTPGPTEPTQKPTLSGSSNAYHITFAAPLAMTSLIAFLFVAMIV